MALWTEEFTGADGSAPDTDYWERSGDPAWELLDNTLYINTIGTTGSRVCGSKFTVSGDFDIQMSVVAFTNSTSGGVRLQIRTHPVGEISTAVGLIGIRDDGSSNNVVFYNWYESGSWGSETEVARTSETGILRQTRVGNTTTLYWADGLEAEFTELASNDIGSFEAYSIIQMATDANNCMVKIDDFTVTSADSTSGLPEAVNILKKNGMMGLGFFS